MVKKTVILLVLYFFLQIYLTSLQGKEYYAKELVRAGCFWPLGAGASQKKIPGAGATWGKNQEPEPLEKKSQEPELELLKNLPAPQPCLVLV